MPSWKPYFAAFTPFGKVLDDRGTLHYFPRPDETPAEAVAVAPDAEQLVVIAGDPAAGKFVEHLTFRGIAFRHAGWRTPPDGFEPMQAAASIEATIQIDGSRHVTFEDCEIGHIASYGIWFRKGCRIRNNIFAFSREYRSSKRQCKILNAK